MLSQTKHMVAHMALTNAPSAMDGLTSTLSNEHIQECIACFSSQLQTTPSIQCV